MKLFLGQLSSIYILGQILVILLPIVVVLSLIAGFVTKLLIIAFIYGYNMSESLMLMLF